MSHHAGEFSVLASDLGGRLRSRRFSVILGYDALVWVTVFVLFAALRFHFDRHQPIPWSAVVSFAVIAASLHTALGLVGRLPHGRARLASLEEMVLLGLVVGSTGIILTIANLLGPRWLPPTMPITTTATTLVILAWGRAVYRRLGEPNVDEKLAAGKARVVVAGAGEAGHQLIMSMLRHEDSKWIPVALLDDDPLKRHRRIRGVPVLGSTKQLGEVADSVEASMVIVAIPSASADCIRDLSSRAADAGLEIKVLPSANDLLSTHVSISDVRDLELTDLLGRHQIDTDVSSIAGYLTGKRVLVTGAGGSIGSELCRQIAKFGPDELIMLDRDESALHAVQLSIYGRAMLDSDDVVLADIRDTAYVNTLFEQRRPHVVFHAAALKHMPMLEQYPGEAVKTNVWGTLSVLEAARANGVERFVNVSTDKAANPENVLGYSKRLAECLTAAVATEADGTYLSVRFGNVLGSRGSVLTAFTAQIAAGGPITVTHPDITRFFMTVQEAVQLVIQAGAIGHDGEVLVLDMGAPVSINAVAQQLIELSGKDIEIVYTGLREGEKLNEELFGDGEWDERPMHPLVSHTPVPPLNPLVARELDPWSDNATTTKALAALCDDLSMSRVVADR